MPHAPCCLHSAPRVLRSASCALRPALCALRPAPCASLQYPAVAIRFCPPMKTFPASSLLAAFGLTFSVSVSAADKNLLAIPGKVIYESKLDSTPGAPWKTAKGKWELAGGALRGSEKAEDNHGAVTRLPNKLG